MRQIAQGHKRVTVNATVVGSIPVLGSELFNVFVFSLRRLVSQTRFYVPPLNTPCLKNSAESGEGREM